MKRSVGRRGGRRMGLMGFWKHPTSNTQHPTSNWLRTVRPLGRSARDLGHRRTRNHEQEESILFHAAVPIGGHVRGTWYFQGADDAEAEELGVGMIPDALGV